MRYKYMSEFISTTTMWKSPKNAEELLSSAQFTAIDGSDTDVYMVWVDINLRPYVTSINKTTNTNITIPLSPNENYKVVDDGHNRFSLGIDKTGILHITGDMHNYNSGRENYPPEYAKKNILYWQSKSANNIKDGFVFCGDLIHKSCIPGNTWSYGRFFKDNDGELYYSARVRAISGTHASGETAVGLYSYDASIQKWTALGGPADNIRPGTYYNVILWENAGMAPNKWYQGFICNFFFDSYNRLHLAAAINSDSQYSGNNRIIYAYSNDKGKTWMKANSVRIPTLPIRAIDGHASRGDLVYEKVTEPFIGSEIRVVCDANGMVGVSHVNKEYHIWDGKKWTENNIQNYGTLGQTIGYLDNKDNLVCINRSSCIMIYDKLNNKPRGYTPDSSVSALISIDQSTLRKDGTIYILSQNKDNTHSILKVARTRAPLYLPLRSCDIAGHSPTFNGTSSFYINQLQIINYGTILDYNQDSCHFIYKQYKGDFSISVKCVPNEQHIGGSHARAGIMIRDSLMALSKHVSLTILPSSKKLDFLVRSVTGNGTVHTWTPNIVGPYWLKMTRTGNTVFGYISTDGRIWKETNKTNINLKEEIYVGLVGCSFNHFGMQDVRFENWRFP